CAEELRAHDGEEAHWPAAEHGDGVAVAYLCELGAEVGGGENVGEQDGVVVPDLFRQLHQSHARERDARELGLQSVERARTFWSAEERGSLVAAVGVRV